MNEILSLGTRVRPKTKAGLDLADRPTDGAYLQKRGVVGVFIGEGTVIGSCTVTIDYDEWDRLAGEDSMELGKIRYTSYLIKTDTGLIGWGGGIEKVPPGV
jgi:hypothetical protein